MGRLKLYGLLLLLVITQALNASVVVNDEIHYIGKVVFPISGVSYANSGDCFWHVEGGVTLVLSFSRSTSLATFFVNQNLKSPLGDESCTPSNITSNFSFPLSVNAADKTFNASSIGGERSIRGTLLNDIVEGTYQFQSAGQFNSEESNWSGSFSTGLKAIPGEFINVSQITGDVTSTIPLGTSEVKDSIPDGSTIVTGEAASAILNEKFGASVTMLPKTIMTRLPIKTFAEREIRTFVLTRGKIDTSIPTRERDYKVITPVATIELATPSIANKRSTNATDFDAEYIQDGDTGEISVKVNQGSVVVTDADNNTTFVTSGTDYSYSTVINQTAWVQPADGGILYGGVENTLGWTIYPGAASYLLEYNFPNPKFSEENPKVPEFVEQSIVISADMYTVFEDLAVVNMIMPEMPETIVEARVFPLDEQGNIITQTVASDRISLTFQ